jgi:hypothetical protein
LKKGKETDKFATLANGCLKYISWITADK